MIIFLNHQTRYEKLPSTLKGNKKQLVWRWYLLATSQISLEMVFAGYIANEQIVVIMMKIG